MQTTLDFRPNFFIAGCPKCATTSMHRYLKAHPQIHMPETKELHYFGKDIRRVVPYAAQSEEEYLSMFITPQPAPLRGEASIYYIYSEFAAEEMHRFNPDAKIIIMIREPVEMIYALHYQHVFNRWCSDPDFRKDLRLQDAERGTDREKIHYRTLVKRLPGSIRRFQELFGKNNVKVILVDDLQKDTAGVYADTLRFLGADDDYIPKQFKRYNENKESRTKLAGSLMAQGSKTTATIRNLVWKNPALYQLLYKIRYFLFFVVNAKNTDRPPMPLDLKTQLEKEFRPVIHELEEITSRDLSDWYTSKC